VDYGTFNLLSRDIAYRFVCQSNICYSCYVQGSGQFIIFIAMKTQSRKKQPPDAPAVHRMVLSKV